MLLVGAAGGIPHYTDFYKHVRLGDIIVSTPNDKGNLYIFCDKVSQSIIFLFLYPRKCREFNFLVPVLKGFIFACVTLLCSHPSARGTFTSSVIRCDSRLFPQGIFVLFLIILSILMPLFQWFHSLDSITA